MNFITIKAGKVAWRVIIRPMLETFVKKTDNEYDDALLAALDKFMKEL